MKISIAITTDIEASKKSSLVYRLSENLRKEFYNLNYGNDLQEMIKGTTSPSVVPTSPLWKS